MRYRLRTLMIFLALGPLLITIGYWIVQEQLAAGANTKLNKLYLDPAFTGQFDFSRESWIGPSRVLAFACLALTIALILAVSRRRKSSST